MFAMNSFVEALDAEGRWESARVEQVLDGNYLVSFVGWSRRYDRWVAPAQLRPTTAVASESDGDARPRRAQAKSRRGELAFKKLVAGDEVQYTAAGRLNVGEVCQVDKFNQMLLILTETGSEEDVHIDSLCFENAEVPSGSEPQKRKRAAPKSKRKTSVISNASADASHTTNGEEGDREPEIREPESAPASDVDCFIKMNDSGTVIEGGDIYQISGSEVCVGVKRVLMDSKAIGSLVVGNVVMDDVTVTTPINRLATTKHPVSRKDRQTLEAFSLLSRRDDLVTGSFEVRLSVRRALLGKLLLKEVKSGLRLASFKKTFSLGIVSPEFDFKIFDLNNKFKQEFSYAFGNLSDLDSLLGNYWDVQSPLGNCTFVTRVTLKVKDLHIVGKVSYARCRMTLPKHYRAFLSKYDISCEETEVADVDVDLA